MAINREEISKPNFISKLSNYQILTTSISPEVIVANMHEDEFEEFIEEWAYSYLNKKYEKIERIGGAGDKGRDVAAHIDYRGGSWENYQCKHYGKKVQPSQFWIEVGKICYFCYKKEYTIPKKYFLVSPMGPSTKLTHLFLNPEKMRKEFIKNWDNYCKTKITTSQEIPLEGEFESFVREFDFSIFNYKAIKEVLKEFEETPYYTKRFGGLKKPRPLPKKPSEEIKETELNYVKKILDAYSEYIEKDSLTVGELDRYTELMEDFKMQRRCFYSAEGLHAYSRDINDPDLKIFENLQEQFYDGIIGIIRDDAKNGFERLKKVVIHAQQLTITSNALMEDIQVRDKAGICHQLANDKEEVVWRR